MPRFDYAILEDVLRKFELDIEESDFGNQVQNSDVVLERIRARLEAAHAEFEGLTDKPYRQLRVGYPTNSSTYEELDAYGGKNSVQDSTFFYLDHMGVVPLDSSQDDTFEVRTAHDTWTDKTDAEGDEWRADYREGTIEYFAGYAGQTLATHGIKDWSGPAARITYRYGALGGDQNEAAQTSLDGEMSTGTGTHTVASLDRLVYGTNVYLIEGSEYVLATVDGSDFTTEQRGLRNTSDETHPDGSTVHYCPLDIREGVAAKAAIELLRQDDTLDILVEAGSNLERNEKMQQLQREWETLVRRVSNQHGSR